MKSPTLGDLTYEYIINLAKYFLEKYKNKEITSLDQLVVCVMSRVPELIKFDYKFNEEIWPPEYPELYENLIEFKAELSARAEYFPFRLMMKKGFDQEAILLIPGTFIWNTEQNNEKRVIFDPWTCPDCGNSVYNCKCQ